MGRRRLRVGNDGFGRSRNYATVGTLNKIDTT